MFACLLCDWLTESEWIWKFLKVKWEGIKGLSQTFNFAFMLSVNSNTFHHKTLERRWHDSSIYLNEKGCWKYLNFIWEDFSIQKLQATQWFSWEKIKWLLQSIWNMSWEFQRIKLKIPLNLFSIWSYLGFIQIIFLQK